MTCATGPSAPTAKSRSYPRASREALSGIERSPQEPGVARAHQCMLPYAMRLIRESLDDTKPRRTRRRRPARCASWRNAQHVPLPDDDPMKQTPKSAPRSPGGPRTPSIKPSRRPCGAPRVRSSATGARSSPTSAALDDLALHLIRITYNRYQQRRRDDRPARPPDEERQTALPGKGRSWTAGRTGTAIPPLRPNSAISCEIQHRLTDGVLEGFSGRDRQIILLYVAGYEPEEIVALIDRLGRKASAMHAQHRGSRDRDVQGPARSPRGRGSGRAGRGVPTQRAGRLRR